MKRKDEPQRHQIQGAYIIKPIRKDDGGFRYGVRVNGKNAHWKVNGKKVFTKKNLRDILNSLDQLEPEGETTFGAKDIIVYPKPPQEPFKGSFKDFENRISRKTSPSLKEEKEKTPAPPEVDEKKLVTGLKNLLAVNGANISKIDQAQLEKLASAIKNLITSSNGGVVVEESQTSLLPYYRKKVEKILTLLEGARKRGRKR